MKFLNTGGKRFAFLALVLIAALAIFVAYRHHISTIEQSRHVRRPLTHDASSALDGQMLGGKFGDSVSEEQRQAVEAALKDSKEPDNTPPGTSQAASPSGKQKIILTQPVQTTVEDVEPTLTWDTPFDGWIYRVHLEDRESHQVPAASGDLDEAIWKVTSPLQRGHAYLWRVDAIAPQSHAAQPTYTSATGQFFVLSEEGEQEIKNARAGNPSHLLLGSLYTRYKMWPEAVLEYRKLVSEIPDSPDAVKLLRNAELHSNAQMAATASQ